MALNIRNQEAERLAEALAKLTGESKTEAVTRALRDRLARVRRERSRNALAKVLGTSLLYKGSDFAQTDVGAVAG